jgi:heme exporter protein D
MLYLYLAYAIMILSVVMLIYEIAKNKKDFILPKGDSNLTTAEKGSAFFSHPATITLLVLLVFMILVNTFVDMDAIMQMVEQGTP